VDAYRKGGGKGDVIGQLTLCFGRDRDKAIDTALEIWPNAGHARAAHAGSADLHALRAGAPSS
jgi:hypothetical protein